MSRSTLAGCIVFVGVLLACSAVGAGAASTQRNAARGNPRTSLTPAGWRVRPAGKEFGVSKEALGFQGPMGSALSPDGSRLLTASSGAARIDSTDLFDLAARKRTDFVPYDAQKDNGPAVFYGAAFSPDGTKAWVSGGGQNVVHVYNVRGDSISEIGQIQTPYFPAGLAYGHTPKGDRIYVANNLAAPASGAGNPPGYKVTVIDPKTDQVTGTIDLGQAEQPFGVAFDRTGNYAYVTNWMGRSVSVIDTATEQEVKDITLSPQNDPLQADHPSAITANPKRDELYTANANSDTVSVIDTKTNTLEENIDVSLAGGPKGATPDGLSVSPDGKTLYVAEAGENAVAVVDLDSREVEGFIPTAWYPSDVKVTPDGKHLVVTNANDSGAGPNPCGPLSPIREKCPPLDPQRDPVPGGHDGAPDTQYSGTMIKGSITTLKVPNRAQLKGLTRQVEQNNQVNNDQSKPQDLGKIKHVIYVIKENRTYDQVFGSLNKGNGDPSLNLFGEDSAPNHRALARQFVTLDNFYADAEVSADGHNWTDEADATDYVDKTWPVNYSPSPRGSERAYDFEDVPLAEQFMSEPLASDPSVPRTAAAPTVGYLWDNAYAHGVSFRDYGEGTIIPGACAAPGNTSDLTHLQEPRFGDHVDNLYDGFNLACSDHTAREPEWEKEFKTYEQNGNLPALEIVRLPNDHTQGTVPGTATPKAYVADNDLALGNLVDAVSHSRYWKNTVILVTEDDAQDGPDHVDAHRTVALAISPYTQTGKVDSTRYSTSSMVATIEGLLGMPPMSINDQRANKMWNSFTGHPDFKPYDAKQPKVTPFGDPGAPTNSSNAPMAAASSRMDFTREDATPEVALNKAVWKSIKGRNSEMPAPRHNKIVASPPQR